jgi:hypothetical protein
MNTFVYSMVGLLIGVLTASTMAVDNEQVGMGVWLAVVVLFTLTGALTGKGEELVDNVKGSKGNE